MEDESLQEPLSLISPKRWAILLSFLCVALVVLAWAFFGSLPIRIEGKGLVFNPGRISSISSPLTGTVDRIFVRGGDTVLAGDIVMELMEPEETVRSDIEGKVFKIEVANGEKVAAGQTLLWLEIPHSAGEKIQVAGLAGSSKSEKLKVGMPVEIALSGVDPKEYGKLKGEVSALLPLWTNQAKDLFPENSDQNAHLIVIDLLRDPTSPSGYEWTFEKGPPFPIETGTSVTFFITLDTRKPINYLFP